MNRIVKGEATDDDVILLQAVTSEIEGKCLCALGEFSIMAVQSAILKFRPDFDKVLAERVSELEIPVHQIEQPVV